MHLDCAIVLKNCQSVADTYNWGGNCLHCNLAPLSHRLNVSYCARWMSFVVRRLQLLQRTSPILTTLAVFF